MDADDIVYAIKNLSEITSKVLAALERIEEKLDGIASESEQVAIQLVSMDTSLDVVSNNLREIAGIARREFDPFQKR
jgi:methyl-accepting chemotaxis protein